MKILKVLALFLLCVINSKAQINLVYNSSFEQYSRCKDDFDQIKLANYWSGIDSNGYFTSASTDSFGNPNCTPEYCNECDTIGGVSVPKGGCYYHYPRTGKGMAQVQMYCDTNILDTGLLISYMRDYLQGRLKTHLTAGQTYCVSFYVTLEQMSAFAVNKIGAYLDNGIIDTATWCGWPQTSHTPQVYTSEIINDTLNWHKIEGSFVANGTETFITIGNFFDYANTDKIATNFDLAIGAGNTLFTWYASNKSI